MVTVLKDVVEKICSNLIGVEKILIHSAVLKESFEGILYHHKRNHKKLSRGAGVWGRSSWKIGLSFKVP